MWKGGYKTREQSERAAKSNQIAADAVITAKILDSNVTAAKIADRTRTIFVPVVDAYNVGGGVAINRDSAVGYILPNAGTSASYGNMIVPADYVSTGKLKALYYGTANGNIRIIHSVDYGAIGEVFNTHSFGVAEATEGVSINVWDNSPEIDLAGIAAGDIASLRFYRNGPDALDTFAGALYFAGWQFAYTADS